MNWALAKVVYLVCVCFFFQNWKKFGNSEFDAPGPNVATTTVSDDVFMTFISSKEVGSGNRAIVVFTLLLIICCSVAWGISFTTMSKSIVIHLIDKISFLS